MTAAAPLSGTHDQVPLAPRRPYGGILRPTASGIF